MATENTNTASAAEAEETKNAAKKLLETLKRLFEWFSELRNKNSIIQQMQQLQDDIEMAVANGEMTKDSIESLYELVSDMEGKLDTINPENVEELMSTLDSATKNIIDESKKQNAIFASKETDATLMNKVKGALEFSGINCGSDSDFNTKFLADAKVIADSKLDKNHLLIEIDGQILEAFASVSASASKNKLEIIVRKDNRQYGDVFDENGDLKEGFSFVPPKDGNPVHDLSAAFCEANNLQYVFDVVKEKERLESELLSKAPPKALFVKSRMEKIALSENGRIQSRYFQDDKTFRIRDTETGDMIRIKTGEKEVKVYMYRNTKDFQVSGKELKLAEWKQQEDGHVKGTASLYEGDADITALLRCDEARKYLSLNGVTEGMQQALYYHETDNRSEKVGKTNLMKVEALKAACASAFGKTFKNGEYSVSINQAKKATYLNISQGNRCISFSFDKNGEPLAINYRNDKNSKSKFIYNVHTMNTSPQYNALRSDPVFEKMFKTARSALNEIGVETNLKDTKPREKVFTLDGNSRQFNIPTADRNLNNGAAYDGYKATLDKTTAEKVNKAALLAIEKRSISLPNISMELSCSSTEAKEIMRRLVHLGVVEERGVATKNTKMSLPEYTELIVKLASDYSSRERFNEDGRQESYAAFLVDAYADAFNRQHETTIESMQPEIAAVLDEVRHAVEKNKFTLSVSEAQRSVQSHPKALRTVETLETLGVLAKNESHEQSYDIICSKDKIMELIKQFETDSQAGIPAEKNSEVRQKKALERDEGL